MLILTRRIGRSIEIAENITVTVLAIKDGQVRLGINAPRDSRTPRRNRRAHQAGARTKFPL